MQVRSIAARIPLFRRGGDQLLLDQKLGKNQGCEASVAG